MSDNNRLLVTKGSSISCVKGSKDGSSGEHFDWESIRIFLYFSFVCSTNPFHFDLFSRLINREGEAMHQFQPAIQIKKEVLSDYYFYLSNGCCHRPANFFNINGFFEYCSLGKDTLGGKLSIFLAVSILIGMTYMFVDLFIKQYTRRVGLDQYMSPLLSGISVSIILNTLFWNILNASDIADAARYLVTSFGETEWSRCHKIPESQCISPTKLVELCKKRHHIHFNTTSAHINWEFRFRHYDKTIITTRFFVSVLLWISILFISTVSETGILKFYKILFWWNHASTVLILFILIISTDHATQAFLQIIDVNNKSIFLDDMEEVITIFGIGLVGVYDFGTMSPFTMIDNAVVIFIVVFICSAFIRSMIVRILYLNMADCVEIEYQILTAHYLMFAVLPLSTEFMYAQKLFTIYLFTSAMLTVAAYLTLYTLTMAKILQMRFRFIKSVYIVGILCIIGFIFSLPIVAMKAGNDVLNGLIAGMYTAILCLGGLRMTVIMYVYGVKKFSTDIHFWLGYKPTRFWTCSWTILPVYLLITAVDEILYISDVLNTTQFFFAMAWFMLSFAIVIVLVAKTIFTYVMCNNLLGAFISSKKYGPVDSADRARRRKFHDVTCRRICLHNCINLDEEVDCNHLPLMYKEKGRSEGSSESLMHLYEAGVSRSSIMFNLEP